LKFRHNTLEPKAYGVSHHGRGNEKGWTVVFRYSEEVIREIEKLPNKALISNPRLGGRAVTMSENFENLLIEHKDFGRKLRSRSGAARSVIRAIRFTGNFTAM
jgi:hypothetical protein